jgi:hypothetical protein
VQKLKDRFEFNATATVETVSVDYPQAYYWAIPHEGASLRNLEGRALPHPNPCDDRVLWTFEIDADAMLFAMRFGGVPRCPIDVGTWRQDHTPD